jgi:hypothetical protein
MGQVLHGCATTTEAVRRAIQHSQKSLRVLAKQYGINQKTVAKWKKRTSVANLPTGPKTAKSTILTVEDEAIIVAFRKRTLLPLDDWPLCAAGDDTRSVTIIVASLLGPPRHFAPPRGGRRQACQEQVQDLPHRLFSH